MLLALFTLRRANRPDSRPTPVSKQLKSYFPFRKGAPQ